jgi:hypothetical protein
MDHSRSQTKASSESDSANAARQELLLYLFAAGGTVKRRGRQQAVAHPEPVDYDAGRGGFDPELS